MYSNEQGSIDHAVQKSWKTAGLLLLLLILLVRLLLMWWLPLTDTTEARYAEIARKMLETGNWVTPLHDYGVPFWAKPPLSTWLSALSMSLFGQNEFAVRLPAFVLGLATLGLTASLAWRRFAAEGALAVSLILASTVLFFVASGTVMTDPALLFCTTLIIVSFWRAIKDGSTFWAYSFFVGVGLGLLAKGPIAIVLPGMAIFCWVLLHNQWKVLWQRLPWLKGSLLALLIAGPWYIWAEIRTPGFLNYFIVGEHFQRFLDPGWQGDKYGFAHATAKGVIWLYAVAALLPWTLLIPLWLWGLRKQPKLEPAERGWFTYLLLCSTLPLLFFSFSGNIIFPYALPVLPTACLLLCELWRRTRVNRASYLPGIAAFTLLLGIILLVLQCFMAERLLRTQKQVVEAWWNLHPAADSQLLYWTKRREFSSEFYSDGRAQAIADLAMLQEKLGKETQDYLVIEDKDLQALPEALQARLQTVATVAVQGDTLLILTETQQPELASEDELEALSESLQEPMQELAPEPEAVEQEILQ